MNTLVKTKTLVNLTSLYPQVEAFSSLCRESNEPIVFERMLFLNEDSDPADIVLAFDADLGKTARILKSIALLLNSADKNGVVQEITSGNNDLKSLFGDRYDSEKMTVEVFGIRITKSMRDLPDDGWKERLYLNIFKSGLPANVAHFSSYDEFKKHKSLMKTYSNETQPNIEKPLDQRIKYCHIETMIENQRAFHSFLMTKANKFSDFRSSLTERSRSELDEKLIASRALIDGVIKSSTYITNDRIIQVSTKHKRESENLKNAGYDQFLNTLHQAIKNNPYIMAIEIDQDTELLKAHDTLIELNGLTFDTDETFVLKFRKIGNYDASGLSVVTDAEGRNNISKQYGYSNRKLRIVAVDVESPSALAHELSHYRDINRSDPTRAAFIEFLKEKMDIETLVELADNGSKYDARYYSSGAEIIARAGEIGFILNKFNYQDGESITDFSARVAVEENNRKPEGAIKYTMSLSEPIDYYLGRNIFTKNIYFNIADWSPEDISIVRDFTRSFFHKVDPDITKRLNEKLNSEELKKITEEHAKRKKTQKTRKISPPTDQEKMNAVFAKMAPGELAKTYQRAIAKSLLRDGEFGLAFSAAGCRLFDGGGAKTSKGISWRLLEKVIEEMRSLSNSVTESNMYYDALALNLMYSSIALKNFSEAQRKQFNLEQTKNNNTDAREANSFCVAEKYQDINESTRRLFYYLKEVKKIHHNTTNDSSENEVTSISNVGFNFYLLSEAEGKSPIPGFSSKALSLLTDAIAHLEKKITSLPLPEQCPAAFREVDFLINLALLNQERKAVLNVRQFCEGEALKQFSSLMDKKENISYFLERSYFKLNLGWDKQGTIIPGPFQQDRMNSLLAPLVNHIQKNLTHQIEQVFNKKKPALEKEVNNYLSNLPSKSDPGATLSFFYNRIKYELTQEGVDSDSASELIKQSISTSLMETEVLDGIESDLNQKMSEPKTFKIKNELANSALGKTLSTMLYSDRTKGKVSPSFVSAIVALIEERLHQGINLSRLDISRGCAEFVANELHQIHRSLAVPPVSINPGLKAVLPYLEDAKKQFTPWLKSLDERYGEMAPQALSFIIERTLGGDNLDNEPKALQAFMQALAENASAVMLPLIISEQITRPMKDIMGDLSKTTIDIESEMTLPIDSNTIAFRHLPEEVVQEIEKLNTSVEPSKDGVLSKKQQMKML